MRVWKISLLITVLSLASGAMLMRPATAQQNQSDITGPNQSDITGPNVFDRTGPNVFDGNRRLDPEVIDRARQISQDLDDAYAACTASRANATTGPRRFARGLAPGGECNSPECQRLNTLIQQARSFLSSLDPVQAELLRSNPQYRLW